MTTIEKFAADRRRKLENAIMWCVIRASALYLVWQLGRAYGGGARIV